jgi:hypothetical protein
VPASQLKGRYQTKSKCGSASYYVGYVEDGESVEMIMKKFDALEKIEKSVAPNQTEDTNLSENQLIELFKETSTFSVNMIRNEPLEGAFLDTLEDTFSAEYYEGYFSDDDQYTLISALFSVSRYHGNLDDFLDDEYGDFEDSFRKKRKLGDKRVKVSCSIS